MRRAIAIGCLLAAAACGRSPEHRVLAGAADKLATVTSGILDMRVTATAEGREPVGFELRGPFQLARRGKLPVADLDYTRLAGSERTSASFVSTGDAAFVTAGGKTSRLADDVVRSLRARADAPNGLDNLNVDAWAIDPELERRGALNHVTAKLDAVEAFNGLFSLARDLGRDFKPIAGKDAERLYAAVRSSSMDVWTGAEDDLLRRVRFSVRLGANAPERLVEALGSLANVTVTADVRIDKPNEPVRVTPP